MSVALTGIRGKAVDRVDGTNFPNESNSRFSRGLVDCLANGFLRSRKVPSRGFCLSENITKVFRRRTRFSGVKLDMRSRTDVRVFSFFRLSNRSCSLFEAVNHRRFRRIVQSSVSLTVGGLEGILSGSEASISRIDGILLMNKASRVPLLQGAVCRVFKVSGIMGLSGSTALVSRKTTVVSRRG